MNRPVAKIVMPIPPSNPGCTFSTSLPASGAVKMVANGQGVSNKPISTALYPNIFCIKKGKETIASIWAVNEVMEVPIERAKIGIFSKSTGRIGIVSFSWRRMK